MSNQPPRPRVPPRLCMKSLDPSVAPSTSPSAPPPECSSVMTGGPGPPTSTSTFADDAVKIKCSICGRQMDFDIAITGQIQGTPCLTCLPYEEVAMAMNEAEEGYRKVQGRRKTHPLYSDALQKHTQTRANYANLILKLEGVIWRPELDQQPKDETHVNQADLKRRRQESLSESPVSPPKRRCSTTSIRSLDPEQPSAPYPPPKKVTFHEPPDLLQEVRRPDEFFNRSNPAYFPGRHAAPEGSNFLDTSGYKKKPRDFYNVESRSDEEELEPNPFKVPRVREFVERDEDVEIERQIEEDMRIGEFIPERAPQSLTSASQLWRAEPSRLEGKQSFLTASRLSAQASALSEASVASRASQPSTHISLPSAETSSYTNGVVHQSPGSTSAWTVVNFGGNGTVDTTEEVFNSTEAEDYDMDTEYPGSLVVRTL